MRVPPAVRILGLAALLAAAPGLPAAFAKGRAVPAPAFTLPTEKGSVSLDSLRGKVVLVDFWASWCGPCHRSFPWMAEMQQKYGPRGFVVVAVNLDKTRDAAATFLASVPAPFTVAYDPSGHIASAYRVEGMPTSVLVGRDGTVLEKHIGYEPARAAAFESLIQEACTR